MSDRERRERERRNREERNRQVLSRMGRTTKEQYDTIQRIKKSITRINNIAGILLPPGSGGSGGDPVPDNVIQFPVGGVRTDPTRS